MPHIKRRYGFLWVTLVMFVCSLAGHWTFGWYAHENEARARGQPAGQVGEYLVEMGRDTLENWQSEFLQLIWQVAGLAFLYYVGSPQSKEGDERLEAKVDYLLSRVEGGDAVRAALDRKYERTGNERPA